MPKLLLISVGNYLLDRRERTYAPPFTDREYTCRLCGKFWDPVEAFKKRHWREDPGGWRLYDTHDWYCADCVELINFQDLLEAYDKDQKGGT